MPAVIAISLAASVLALLVGGILYRRVLSAPATNERANEIAEAIKEGAIAFLNRQYRTVAMVGVPVLGVVWYALNGWYAGGFVLGAVASAMAGFIGMNVSVRANVRVAEAASTGFQRAFALSFQGGALRCRRAFRDEGCLKVLVFDPCHPLVRLRKRSTIPRRSDSRTDPCGVGTAVLRASHIPRCSRPPRSRCWKSRARRLPPIAARVHILLQPKNT